MSAESTGGMDELTEVASGVTASTDGPGSPGTGPTDTGPTGTSDRNGAAAGPEAAAQPDTGDTDLAGSSNQGFTVHLDNFEGPFDLLLGLISKHKLDVTEVALARVTDEFIDYIRAKGPEWDLNQATEFLLVASTLLDLKAARLIPHGEVEDEDDLALLEARDLLFARLLQYRAYKQIAELLGDQLAREARRFPRSVGLEERFGKALPEVLIGIGVDRFAELAAKALTPKPEPTFSTAHVHAPRVSVREQAGLLVDRLRRHGASTFRSLTADCDVTMTVARFLALLELFREGAVAFEQAAPLAELTIRWSGAAEGEVQVGDEFDADGSATAAPEAGDPGAEDAGAEDPGTEDAGTEDAGTEDAGTEDAGAGGEGDSAKDSHEEHDE